VRQDIKTKILMRWGRHSSRVNLAG